MKRFYSRFRVLLFTFALGLACVPFSNNIYERLTTIQVDLPQTESSPVINVFVPPKRKLQRYFCTDEYEGYCYCSPHGKGIKGTCAAVNEELRLKYIEDEKNGEIFESPSFNNNLKNEH
jgi:hypothetical protein